MQVSGPSSATSGITSGHTSGIISGTCISTTPSAEAGVYICEGYLQTAGLHYLTVLLNGTDRIAGTPLHADFLPDCMLIAPSLQARLSRCVCSIWERRAPY